MDITASSYPAFRANQVLTSAHLNDLFGYLDEQQRLTRAELIGIGIVCGLEVTFEAPGTVHLTRGVGVTSQGYLIAEPQDLALAWAKPYVLPEGDGYPQFRPGEAQLELWELFGDDDEPDAAPLDTVVPELADKVVVLFHELAREDQRSCRPDDCDDQGAAVTASIRRLLVDATDLDAIAAALAEAGIDLGPDLDQRVGLPDLRMPRTILPNTGPIDTDDLLRAFQGAFSDHALVKATGQALSALYAAFRPLLVDVHPADPFGALVQRFGFLDDVPTTPEQVLAMPTYWDLFDDLLAAYEEARRAGGELLCACSPPGELFPRHLVAGVLDPTRHDPAAYRRHFVASPAVGDCADRTRTFRTLVERLVAMVRDFTETPPTPDIRATPSRCGDAALGEKAIPAYYDLAGEPPLYRLWDPVKTARRRAHHNLGYRAGEYSPAAPLFVTEPLRFDLEPNNFLRIEGHLGRGVRDAVEALQQLQTTRRLPFEVVAIRTGAYDKDQPIDLERSRCRFRDLDTLYAALKAGMVDFLVTRTRFLYTLPFESPLATEPAPPSLGLLKTYDPGFVVAPNTLGRLMETSLTWRPGSRRSKLQPVAGTPDLAGQALDLVTAMSDLSGLLADDVAQVDFEAVGTHNRRVGELAEQMAVFAAEEGFDRAGLADRLAEITARSREDAFEVIAKEYRRRTAEAQQAQFLDHFLTRHPGVQHKAGVPLGGTFVLVYHGPPGSPSGPRDVRDEDRLADILDRLRRGTELADADLGLLSRLTGRDFARRRAGFGSRAESAAYAAAVRDLADGTVVADFFLPYACGSDCPPVLCAPTEPPGQLTVTAAVGCTNADQHATVDLSVVSASGTLMVRVDDGEFSDLTGSLLLPAGPHTVVVRDGTGRTSAPLAVTVPPALSTSPPKVVVGDRRDTYRVEFRVEGGTPPYAVDPGSLDGAAYTSPDVPVAEALTVRISDAAGCVLERTVAAGAQPCDLPCGGESQRWGHRFWLPEPSRALPISSYRIEVAQFLVTGENGQQFDMTDKAGEILRGTPERIDAAQFVDLVNKWLALLTELVAGTVGSEDWLTLAYEPRRAGTTGTLVVDRLSCLDFRIELALAYHHGRSDRTQELITSYSPDGTRIIDRQTGSEVEIPRFSGTRANKCRPAEPARPLCTDVDLQLAIRSSQEVPQLILDAVPTGASAQEVVGFVWEVQDAIPPLFSGQRILVQEVVPVEPTKKNVRLTAITKRGCVVTLDQVVDVIGRG